MANYSFWQKTASSSTNVDPSAYTTSRAIDLSKVTWTNTMVTLLIHGGQALSIPEQEEKARQHLKSRKMLLEETEGEVVVPDLTEAIIAERVWLFNETGLLRSVYLLEYWQPGQWKRARCNGCGVFSGKTDCGIYAFKQPTFPSQYQVRGDRPYVRGTVELAGIVKVHKRGYRAERARIRSLIEVKNMRASGRMLKKLAKTYDVPIEEAE